MEVALTAYIRLLTDISSFKDLGRVLSESDYCCPVAIRNLGRVQQKWARLLQVLDWEGGDARNLGEF